MSTKDVLAALRAAGISVKAPASAVDNHLATVAIARRQLPAAQVVLDAHAAMPTSDGKPAAPVFELEGKDTPTAVFVSYRRTDAPGHAGRLYDRLADRYGEQNVFKDLDSLEPGADFAEVIQTTISRCDVLIAVIGPQWLDAEEGGVRRLDDPLDWVRLEIANALDRRIRVIPVLVNGASMPSEADLPDALRPLARRYAIELNEIVWRSQVAQLVGTVDMLTKVPRPAP
jgi:hypothetical protein